ncbi:hypothetical protein QYE76_068459 [Lolium multiflorum]|uniref:Pantoate--beta-alanine ligase n=1 Tax=Lolium multiflorum TaxID=4521 RepID=A0AAD8SEU7_LOLMU|nr:hypothetical protein QYE76_068459 [Lolium multiflorum]
MLASFTAVRRRSQSSPELLRRPLGHGAATLWFSTSPCVGAAPTRARGRSPAPATIGHWPSASHSSATSTLTWQSTWTTGPLVRDLDFAIEIIGSEIVREADGLAMSSRNVHLSCEEREKALSINRSLVNARTAALTNSNSASQHMKNQIAQALSEAGGRVDYVEIVEQESLVPVDTIDRPVVICVAAWFGKVRLIDNIEIHPGS